jgi:hypothetical protein
MRIKGYEIEQAENVRVKDMCGVIHAVLQGAILMGESGCTAAETH